MAIAATFSALPAELRLLIADYVFEQPRDTALEVKPDGRLQLADMYSSASHLRPLQVCRQL